MDEFFERIRLEAGVVFYDSIQNRIHISQDELPLSVDVESGSFQAGIETWYAIPKIGWLENVKTQDSGIVHLF